MKEDRSYLLKKYAKTSLHVHKDTTTRKVNSVPEVIKTKLSSEELWSDKERTKPNLTVLRKHLSGEGRLETEDAIRIMELTEKMLDKEPNLLRLDAPLTICGDIHGQFFDLLKLFDISGTPDKVNFLFLGDYVDRGMFGCEVVIYLWSWKLNYPDKIHFLRGNHECRHLTEYFNFKRESIYKYGISFYLAVMKSFDSLPLAALMDEKFFCVHGGLSPQLETLEDLKKIDRKQEVPSRGLFCDLLWADPVENYDNNDDDENASTFEDYFKPNETRGCSYSFTYAAVCRFLDNNNLLAVFRAHEVQYQGYRMYKERDCEDGQFPSMITIFSAPNYCDDHGNKAAVLEYGSNDLLNIKQFKAVEHPYWLPNFSNVFNWSLPFVQEKITEIILTLSQLDLKQFEEEMETKKKEGESLERIKQDKEIILNKIKALGKLASLFTALRKENENQLKVRALREKEEVPEGVVTEGPITKKANEQFFQESIKAHQPDEMMPTIETNTEQNNK